MLYYRRMPVSAGKNKNSISAAGKDDGEDALTGTAVNSCHPISLRRFRGKTCHHTSVSLINMEYFRFVDILLQKVTVPEETTTTSTEETSTGLFAVVQYALTFTLGALVHNRHCHCMGPPKPVKQGVRTPKSVRVSAGYSSSQSTHTRFESSDSDTEQYH